MNALVYTAPHKVEYQTIDDLVIKNENEQKVKVYATGICGSDLHAFIGHDARRVPPLVLGHEVFGEVIEGSLKGKKVCVNPILSCLDCDYCNEGRDNLCPNRKMIGMNVSGGFADFIVAPQRNCVVVRDDLDYRLGALAEPLGTCYHAVDLIKKTAFKSLESSKALVIGAGAIGVLSALMLRYTGCKDITIIDRNADRLTLLKGLEHIHADTGVDNEKVFDVVVDAVGINPTRDLSLQVIKPGGVMMHVGLGGDKGEINMRQVTLEEISILGTYAYRHSDFEKSVSLLENYFNIDEMPWITTMSMKDGQQAFDDLISNKCSFAKVMLTP